MTWFLEQERAYELEHGTPEDIYWKGLSWWRRLWLRVTL